MGTDKLRSKAVEAAQQILNGELDPNRGCVLIADIGRQLKSPKEFDVFEMLAHDQHGHDEFGIHAKDCVREILEECRVLVSR